jgi:plastocyanin
LVNLKFERNFPQQIIGEINSREKGVTFMSTVRLCWSVLALLAVCLLVLGASNQVAMGGDLPTVRQIMVPLEDRFTPFAITVKVGQPVQWVNNDADDHRVVSVDAFNTAGHRGIDVLVPANGGTFSLKFQHAGTFPFYCRFHAMLDSENQPIAPGPFGGIQDDHGNFGTPMAGVVTVIEDH